MPAKYQPYFYLIGEILVLANYVLTERGINPITISDTEIWSSLSYIAALIAFGFAMWKNHNFTGAAQIAQHTLNQIKGGADPFADTRETEEEHELEDPED